MANHALCVALFALTFSCLDSVEQALQYRHRYGRRRLGFGVARFEVVCPESRALRLRIVEA